MLPLSPCLLAAAASYDKFGHGVMRTLMSKRLWADQHLPLTAHLGHTSQSCLQLVAVVWSQAGAFATLHKAEACITKALSSRSKLQLLQCDMVVKVGQCLLGTLVLCLLFT